MKSDNDAPGGARTHTALYLLLSTQATLEQCLRAVYEQGAVQEACTRCVSHCTARHDACATTPE